MQGSLEIQSICDESVKDIDPVIDSLIESRRGFLRHRAWLNFDYQMIHPPFDPKLLSFNSSESMH